MNVEKEIKEIKKELKALADCVKDITEVLSLFYQDKYKKYVMPETLVDLEGIKDNLKELGA